MGWAARFLTAVSFLAAGVLFAPDALLGGSPGRPSAGVAAARLAHLLCFATAWGAALWVTFIGGIVMFKNLPRHQFGNLQGKMFPAYFMLISVCSAISVAAFAYLQSSCLYPHDHRDDDEEAQDREGPRHRQRGGGFEEFRRCEDESRACGDEQEVRDDPRAVVAGKHHGVRQPCHALLASRQQAQAVTG